MADRLGLPLMVADNRDPFRTACTVSIDAAEGVTTNERGGPGATIGLLADPSSTPERSSVLAT